MYIYICMLDVRCIHILYYIYVLRRAGVLPSTVVVLWLLFSSWLWLVQNEPYKAYVVVICGSTGNPSFMEDLAQCV